MDAGDRAVTTPIKRILLVYPKFPITHSGMQYYCRAVGKSSSYPPLGLITIAALTPPGYEFRLVDENVREADEDDIAWADMVCFSAMLIQKRSMFERALRCRALGKLVVFGGPYPTACPQECAPYCDTMVLSEGEITWPMFLRDLEKGFIKKTYDSAEKPDMTKSPTPRFDLLDIRDYMCMPVQFSRGCPFMCEFCDIIVTFGRRPRVKTPEQVIKELEAIHETGYRGLVHFVNDNFIGNKKDVKNFLPVLKEWNRSRGYPFYFATESSINLAEEDDLLQGMVDNLFIWVFLGLESPSEESLRETKKLQNIGTSMLDRIRKIQQAGLLVSGGFIIGFDNDKENIFDLQIDFITQAAIPNAAVGLLYALPGTPLYDRLAREGRLDLSENIAHDRGNSIGRTNPYATNIITIIPRERLLSGYMRVRSQLYDPVNYFRRSFEVLMRLPAPRSFSGKIEHLRRMGRILSQNASMRPKRTMGVRRSKMSLLVNIYKHFSNLPGKFRGEALRFIWCVLIHCPHQLIWVMPHVFMGAHIYKFVHEHEAPRLKEFALHRVTNDPPAVSVSATG